MESSIQTIAASHKPGSAFAHAKISLFVAHSGPPADASSASPAAGHAAPSASSPQIAKARNGKDEKDEFGSAPMQTDTDSSDKKSGGAVICCCVWLTACADGDLKAGKTADGDIAAIRAGCGHLLPVLILYCSNRLSARACLSLAFCDIRNANFPA